MNFIKDFQLFTFILFGIYGTMGEEQQQQQEQEQMPYDNCEITPTDQDKVDIVVYINGGTEWDDVFYSRYCSWRDDGFPYSQYAPVTIKVGAEITCDENNACNCPNTDSVQGDCTATFQHVCAEQILGQEEFQKLMCCSALAVPGSEEGTSESKGFQACVDEQPGLQDKITDCLAKTGDGSPQDVALKNAQELLDKGIVVTEDNTEPFFFYNGVFDECISADSPYWFVQKICAMLKYDIASCIDQCKEAMAW